MQGPVSRQTRQNDRIEAQNNQTSWHRKATKKAAAMMAAKGSGSKAQKIIGEGDKQRTAITSRDTQIAVHLHLPGELVKHAFSEGTKAVTKYISFK
ncbi:histone H2B 1/2/3/4/6-like [Armigeres subalbatus]|uniref:histone H2B 1/2/3/4/6-like n=1 Tax=Armigeres subalbatus TaxID=124917 RepID=UPI002ED561E9